MPNSSPALLPCVLCWPWALVWNKTLLGDTQNRQVVVLPTASLMTRDMSSQCRTILHVDGDWGAPGNL